MKELDYIEGDWTYDLETYPNCFTFSIIRCDGKFKNTFEVSNRKNELNRILDCLRYLKSNNQRMVSFNGIGFDYPIIHELMNRAVQAKSLNRELKLDAKFFYELAQKQIESFKGEGFGHTIQTKDILIQQVDLFKINHFDNKARATSLKMIEFNMRSKNIEDLPFPVGTYLTDEQIDTLIVYNEHDVKMTLEFYYKCLEAIRFRAALGAKYSMDFTNHNDTKVGKDFFIQQLEKKIPGSCYKINHGRKKINQTKRDHINIKDVLFNYYDFNQPAFVAIKDWFSKQVITETKGVFSDIEEHLLFDVAKYAELTVKKKKFKAEPTFEETLQFEQEHPKGWIEPVVLKSGKISYWGFWKVAETLNVVINGFRFDFGTGGIHGSVSSSIVRAGNGKVLKDSDVASMYPNIAISNNSYPEHLGKGFCTIYKDVYEQRKSYPKGSAENAVLKLALNGVYGDSNNPYSPFFDAQYTMAITINGQLSLCLLAERLLTIEGLSLVQVNTDGVTYLFGEKHINTASSICSKWEKDVKLQLETVDYSAMYIRDVNNYISVYTDGKTKRKGAYQYSDLGWHQNQSSLVIPMAAEAQMLYNTPVEEFIRNHKEKFDFMLRTKVPRSSSLVLVQNETDIIQQNICRYYPSKEGGKLVKIMPPLETGGELRRLSIDKEYNVKTCNDIKDFTWDLDYDYYINEAKKLLIEETMLQST